MQALKSRRIVDGHHRWVPIKFGGGSSDRDGARASRWTGETEGEIGQFDPPKKVFPSLWIIVQCESARSAVEVGCERFFSVSGYVSAPRRTRLGVRTYERLALMSVILNTIYIDKKWVAKEYLRRCKEGAWSEERTEEALKCWNLERVIEAELMGKLEPEELTMEELIKEGQV